MNKSKISPSGSGKKLVQARLPFKTLSSSEKVDKKLELKVIGDDKKIKSKETNVGKRKSLDEIVKPPAKIPRKDPKSAEKSVLLSDEKENSKSSKSVEIVISDDESIFDAESNASSVNENRDENIEPKSSEASLISEADAADAPSSKKSLKFGKSPNLASDRLFQVKFPITLGKKKAAQTELKKNDVKSMGKKKQSDKTPSEDGVVVLDESDKEEEVKSDSGAKTETEKSSEACKIDEKVEETKVDEAKAAETIDIPDSDEDQSVDKKEEPEKAPESTKEEIKKPMPVKEITKRVTDSKVKETEKVVDEFDATLGLRFSDSETEMGDESKAEMKRKSKSPQVPPEVVLRELRVILTPIAAKRKRSSVQTASPSVSKRETPSRKAKQTKLEAPASVVLEVSDNAMDISLSEKESAVDMDKSIGVSTTDPLAVSTTEPRTPKLRSTNKPNSNVTSSEKKTGMSKLQRQKEKEEKEQQRLKEKEEREEKRRKEKEEKEEQKRREKEEKEEQKRKEKEEKEEQRRKEKEEKEEQRKKEKEEKEKKRLAELEAKNEEKRQKDEERKKREEQKEEERRKKEEERRKKEQEKEEAEIKKKKAAEAFTRFFSLGKKTTAGGVASEVQQSQKLVFMPFRIKSGMKLAPIQRRELKPNDKDVLDNILKKSQAYKVLYLEELKKNMVTPRSTSATLTENYEKTSDSDIEIIDDDLKEVGETIEESKPIQKFRAKFLWFHENRRPPYYGTFRKKSDTVKPRRPFATDKKFFDYEVDSDDEWEEEEIGESLHGSDDEKEKESEDEYEVDNEFFVPHGHLSDEELQREDELDEIDDDDDATREAQKEKMKLLEEEFNQSIKKRTEKIQPRLVGIVWQDENGNRPESCCEKVWTSLMARAMVTHGLFVLEPPENSNPTVEPNITASTKKVSKKAEFDAEDIKNLAILIHGNRHNRQFLIREFQAFVNKDQTDSAMSKFANITIKNQFDKIAKWSVYSNDESKKKKLSWIVSDEILKQYGLENIGLKNTWKYVTEPKYENENEEGQIKDDEPKSRPSTPSVITKFTKILNKEQKDQKFCKSPSTSEQKNAFKILEGESSKSASKKENEADSGKSTKRISDSAKKASRNRNSSKMKKRNIFEKKVKKPGIVETIELDDSNCDTDEEDVKTKEKESPEAKKDEPPIKKRAVLLSVPLGTEISESVKNEFILKTLKSKTGLEPAVVNEQVPKKEKPVEQPQKKKRVPLLSAPFGKVITEDAKKEFVSKVLTQTKLKTEIAKNSENKETLVASKTPAKNEVSDTSKDGSGKVSKRPLSPEKDQPPAKKRVPLLSVPLGKTIPDDLRNAFVSKNLAKRKECTKNELIINGTIELSDQKEKTKSKAQIPDTKFEGPMEVCEGTSLKSEQTPPSDEAKTINEKSSQATKSEDTTETSALTESNQSESVACSNDVQPVKELIVETCSLSVEETSAKSETDSPKKETSSNLESIEQVTTKLSCPNDGKTEEASSSVEKFQVGLQTEKNEESSSGMIANSEEKETKSENASTQSNSQKEKSPLLAESTKLEDMECSNEVQPIATSEAQKSISIEEQAVDTGSSSVEETSEKRKTGSPKKEISNDLEFAKEVTTKISCSNEEPFAAEKETDIEDVSTTLDTPSISQKEISSLLTVATKSEEIECSNIVPPNKTAEAHKSTLITEHAVAVGSLPAESSSEKFKNVSPENETSKDTDSADQITTKISSTNDEKSEETFSSTERFQIELRDKENEESSSVITIDNEEKETKSENESCPLDLQSTSTEEKSSLSESSKSGDVENSSEVQRAEAEEAAGTGSLSAEDCTSEKFRTGLPEKETSKDIFAETITKSSLDDEKVSTASKEEIVEDDSKTQTKIATDRAQNDEKEEDVIAFPETEMPSETIKELSTPDSSTE